MPENEEIEILRKREMELESRVRDLETCLKEVKRELGSILDSLIDLLPKQHPNYITTYAVIMSTIRDMIKEIESLEE